MQNYHKGLNRIGIEIAETSSEDRDAMTENGKWQIENITDAMSDCKTFEVRRYGMFFCTTASVKTANKIISAIEATEAL